MSSPLSSPSKRPRELTSVVSSSTAGTSFSPDLPRKRRLEFGIHGVSSSSSNFLPENVLADNPHDASSRWSSDSNTLPQFLTLLLPRPAVVSSVTFGKFEKSHMCNLKRFKIYGGYDEENMVELLDGGLKNDSSPETLRLKYNVAGHLFPCRFIKVMPIQAWGPSFNFSIWYLSLSGDDSDETVSPALEWHSQYREREAIRLCLKHFRQHNYSEAFASLLKKTKVQLEDPLLTELYEILVEEGDYTRTEEFVNKVIDDGLFDSWIEHQQPQSQWTALVTLDENPPPPVASTPAVTTPEEEESNVAAAAGAGPAPLVPVIDSNNETQHQQDVEMAPIDPPEAPLVRAPVSASGTSLSEAQAEVAPSPGPALPTLPAGRGGHQMIIDSQAQVLYMFGGYDGHRDLNDFWSYDIASNKWTLISLDTAREGGPGPRSCHKMLLDPECRLIFVLGKYLERHLRNDPLQFRNDFYMYDLNTSRWTQITDDTLAMGGPSLLFDHQMSFDQQMRIIYVFGGQTLFYKPDASRADSEKRYSGFFEYHIPTNTWRKRKDDCGSPATGEVRGNCCPGDMRSRSGHSMLFHPGLRKLFVFGGLRKCDEHLTDFFSYAVDTDEVEIICAGTDGPVSTLATLLPAVGHTQRASIDVDRGEIHVMTGINKDRDKSGDKHSDARASNTFWVYSLAQNKWSCYYKNDNVDQDDSSKAPRPRYAHQLAYDEINKIHYMFGGNQGGKEARESRLGDFWRFFLHRPSRKEVLRRCKLALSKTRFCELTLGDKIAALQFLQTELSEMVNHDDIREGDEFRRLASKIFEPSTSSSVGISLDVDRHHSLRTELFEKLCNYFPEEMTHPRMNLTDLMPYPMD